MNLKYVIPLEMKKGRHRSLSVNIDGDDSAVMRLYNHISELDWVEELSDKS